LTKIDEPTAEQRRELQWERERQCDHEWRRAGSMGGAIVFYECRKCGGEYEKDVS